MQSEEVPDVHVTAVSGCPLIKGSPMLQSKIDDVLENAVLDPGLALEKLCLQSGKL